MTRTASTLDRIAAALIGLLVIAVGAGALIWNTALFSGIPGRITAAPLITATAQSWWPWAVAGAGVLLVIIGARWLLTHTPAATTKPLPLHETDDRGTITVDLTSVTDAAAQTLAQRPDVRSAKGKAVIDRGTRTLDLTVSVAADENLAELTGAIDAVCADLARAIGDPTLAARTLVRIDTSAGAARRVA